MPCTVQELQRRLLNLEKVNRSQAVKIWQLEEENMDLVRKVERMIRKENGSREEETETNSQRTVHFGGVHFSDDTMGREKVGDNDVNTVEEVETVLVAALPLQEVEETGSASVAQLGSNGKWQVVASNRQIESSPKNTQANDAEVLPKRQNQREFIMDEDEVGESESLARRRWQKRVQADNEEAAAEINSASSLEVERAEMGTSEMEESQLLNGVHSITPGVIRGVVRKEKQMEENSGKRLVVEKLLPSKSVGEVSTVRGENDLENSVKLMRVLRGRPKTPGKRLASKAIEKELQVEEVSAPSRKRRLASQGKPKEGDRLKVAWGGKFYSCKVVLARQSALKVHYMGWGAEFEEWVPFPSNKVKLDK